MFTVQETMSDARIFRPHQRTFDKEILMKRLTNKNETLLTWTDIDKANKFVTHLTECRERQGIESIIITIEI